MFSEGPWNEFGGIGGDGNCPTPGYSAGIASGSLDSDAPRLASVLDFELEGSATRDAVRLHSGPNGLLALGSSFWALEHDGEARWYPRDAYRIQDVILGDLDEDGDADLVTREELDDGPESVRYALTIWEETESGLVARADLPAAYESRYAAGDVDGDGDLDLVTFDRGLVVVERNDGGFSFSTAESSPAEDAYALFWMTRAIALDDRDEDGISDLIVLALHGDETHILTLRGDGSGQFSAPVAQPLVGFDINQFDVGYAVAGDVTGDDQADFVIAAFGHILVIEAGTANASAAEISGNGSNMQLLDFDADGMLDIAARTHKDVEIYVSRGSGAFETRALGVGTEDLEDFEITLASGERPVELHALYRMSCFEPCNASCVRCMFGACVECMTHGDCTTGECVRHECTTGEPIPVTTDDVLEDDAGVP